MDVGKTLAFLIFLFLFTSSAHSLTIGETQSISAGLCTELKSSKTSDWIRELYCVCGLKNPSTEIVWSTGPSKIEDCCNCSVVYNFDKNGEWKFGLTIAIINKTWNGTDWNVETDILKSTVLNISVSAKYSGSSGSGVGGGGGSITDEGAASAGDYKEASAPERICASDTKRCLNSTLQECVNNTWANLRTCEYGCDNINFTCYTIPQQIQTTNKTFINESANVIVNGTNRTGASVITGYAIFSETNMMIGGIIIIVGIFGLVILYFKLWKKPKEKRKKK